MTQVSRADLLRVLCLSSEYDDDDTALKNISKSLGFDYHPKEHDNKINDNGETSAQKSLKIGAQKNLAIEPMQARPRYWAVESDEQLEKNDDEQALANQYPAYNKIAEIKTNMRHHYIWSEGAWQNCWDEFLPIQRDSHAIDMDKTVKLITQGQPIKRLPRQQVKSFNHALTVIIERSDELYPMWNDFDRAWCSLARLFGESQLNSYFIDHGLEQPWWHLEMRETIPPQKLDENNPIVLIGAFSALSDGMPDESWSQLIKYLQDGGQQLLIISCVPLKLPFTQKSSTQIVALDSRPSKHLDWLLSALSLAWYPRDKQLRQLRFAIPELSLADELLAFQSSEMEKTALDQRNFKPNYLLKRLRSLNANQPLKQKSLEAARKWQGHLGGIQREIEHLQGQLLDHPDPEHYPKLLALAAQPKNETEQSRKQTEKMLQTLLPTLLMLNETLGDTKRHQRWQPLFNKAKEIMADKQGSSSLFNEESKKQLDNKPYVLQQVGRSLVQSQQEKALINFKHQPINAKTWQPVERHIQTFNNKILLVDQQRQVSLKAIAKPNWAERIWRNKKGLFAAHTQGFILQWQSQNNQSEQNQSRQEKPEQQQPNWQSTQQQPAWASDYGIDQYGLWADLRLNKNTSMKMRWIVAGSFLMGSPEGEEGRSDDEKQHEVKLTQGYWLAETSCTQTQWQAVMGDNPSNIKESTLPVNKISWDDCQMFIASLQKVVPDFQAQLPTEAQWENACRAASTTAYWWGNKFDESKANNGSKLRDERNYPMNNFGLRSMSGNVFEWCDDYFGQYTDGLDIDSSGKVESGRRVLRGGGWIGNARGLRSARRLAYAPGDRYRSIGLRLAGGLDPQASSAGKLTADRRAPSKASQQAEYPRGET